MAEATASLVIESFDNSVDSANAAKLFDMWLGRFENYLTAVNITAGARKKAMLLHHAGKRIYEIYSGLKGTTDDYAATVKIITDYFAPSVNAIFEIETFRSALQGKNERFDHFVVRLRGLGSTCGFTDLNIELRQQIVSKCYSSALRKKGLAENLDLQTLLGYGRSFELADLKCRELEAEREQSQQINKVHELKPTSESHRGEVNCKFCGRPHKFGKDSCPAYGKECSACKRMNHFAAVCAQKRISPQSNEYTNGHQQKKNSASKGYCRALAEESNENPIREHPVSEVNRRSPGYEGKVEFQFSLDDKSRALPYTLVRFENFHNLQPIDMLIDTGSSINVIDEDTYNKLQPPPLLTQKNIAVFGFQCSNPINLLGKFTCLISVNNSKAYIEMAVTKGREKCLLGYRACQALNLVKLDNVVLNIKDDDFHKWKTLYPQVFSGQLGKLTKVKLKLDIDKTVKPIQIRHRRIPFSMREGFTASLNQLLKDGVVERVPESEETKWILPAMAVPKKNGEVRIVVDGSSTKQAIRRTRHLTPTMEDIISEMNGATHFAKLDLKSGFHQIELDEASRYITTFSCHEGLFRHTRLNLGIPPASEDFQFIIQHDVLVGLKGVKNICDDLIVFGNNAADLDEKCDAVLKRLSERGLTVNIDKCAFNQQRIVFFGMVFSAEGIQLAESKIKALNEAKAPSTPGEISSLLGLSSYCSRFIPNHATVIEPLRQLARKGATWNWGDPEKKAFEKIKSTLTNEALAYYNSKWDLEVVVDASPVGLGAILVQVDPIDRENRQILAYASRALSDVEKRYSQIEKEGLACDWGCEKFHMYLYGRHFKLVSDNKALQYIFKNPKTKTPARIERMCLRLAQYNFDAEHHPGKGNPADFLSRNPVEIEMQRSTGTEEYINYLFTHALPLAITRVELIQECQRDKRLLALVKRIQGDGSSDILFQTKIFDQILSELCVTDDGIVMRQHLIVIPEIFYTRVIDLAHDGHQGIRKTKELLRSKVYFPGIDALTEERIRSCMACQVNSRSEYYESCQASDLPSSPWEIVAIDFYSVENGSQLLLIIDEYSRYAIVREVNSTSAENVLPILHDVFSMFGIPAILKSDNGPPFNGVEYEHFCSFFGIHYRFITPYWPQANAEAERFMQNFSKVFQNAAVYGTNWRFELNQFMAAYRSTPHSSTGVAPASLMFKAHLASRLEQMKDRRLFHSTSEDEIARLNDKYSKLAMVKEFDSRKRTSNHSYEIGDKVLVKPHRGKIFNKKSPKREIDPYTIVAIKESMVTVQRGEQLMTRNSSVLKPFTVRSPLKSNDDSPSRTSSVVAPTLIVPNEISNANAVVESFEAADVHKRTSARQKTPIVRLEYGSNFEQKQ